MDEKLCIIIPCYNAQSTLHRTFQSLQMIPMEKRNRVVIIVTNDGSTDQTGRIIDEASGAAEGFEWRVIHQENAGLSQARNAALALAKEQWIFFLDADDELAHDLTALIDEHAGATCVGMSLAYYRSTQQGSAFDRKVKPALASPENFFDVFSKRNPFQPSSLLFRADCLDYPFDPNINVVNDWLFWMENSRLFSRMTICPKVIAARIHIHGSNMSTQYETAGRNREKVSEMILAKHGEKLKPKERNNFKIQSRIGRMQQGQPMRVGSLLLLPCSLSLHIKLWIYSLASIFKKRASRY